MGPHKETPPMMKKTLLGTALSLATVLTALPAMAQPGQGDARDGHRGRVASCEGPRGPERGHARGERGPNPERFLERMKADLDLSDSQVRRIRAVFERSRQEARGLERSEDNRQAHREIHERT